MVLPIAAALGEMLEPCGDYMEPQLHSFKKFSEELGKLLQGTLPLWAKSITRMPLHAESCTTPTDIGISLETHNRFAGHYAEKRQRKQTQQRSQLSRGPERFPSGQDCRAGPHAFFCALHATNLFLKFSDTGPQASLCIRHASHDGF